MTQTYETLQYVDRSGDTQEVALLGTHLAGTNKTLGDYIVAADLTAGQTVNLINQLITHVLTLQQTQNGLAARIAQIQAQAKQVSFNTQ
ncbi:MAG: hypothetical protein ABSE48_15920 [Verrucomicrobiota bacterium]|jgi:hypothetical protein